MRILASILALCLPAFGAVSYTVPTAAVASTSNVTSYPLASFTPSANVVLTMEVCATGTLAPGSITSTAGATLTWTKETSTTNATDTCYLFWARTGGSPGASTFAFDCTGDAATGAVVAIKSWAGADITSPDPILQAVGSSGASSTAPTWTVVARSTNSGYASFFYSTTAPPAVMAPTGWTRDVNSSYSTPTTGFDSASRATGETGTSITWGSTSTTAWRGIAYEVSAPRAAISENLSPANFVARNPGGLFVVSQQVQATHHFVASGGGAGIAVVSGQFNSGSGNTTASLSFPSSYATGNAIFVIGRTLAGDTLTISQTGNSFTKVVNQDDGSFANTYLWRACNISGGSNAISVSSAGSSIVNVVILEVSGLSASCDDQSTSSTFSFSAPTTGTTPVTTTANEIVIAGFGYATGDTSGVCPGYTQVAQFVDTGQNRVTIMNYKIVSATGTQGCTQMDTGGTYAGSGVIGTFK